jgi:tetratricopeptide (TPR) repeat protein
MKAEQESAAQFADHKTVTVESIEELIAKTKARARALPEEFDHGSLKEQAKETLEEAFEAPTCDLHLKLACKALALYPHLPDAWIMVGEHEASNPKEILPYFQKAVEAGRMDLGEDFFKENEGYFWGLHETRPFMRAKAFLAQALWDLGREDEAIEHYQDCLKLNPSDNQGLRYALVGWLLAKDRLSEVEKILKQYKDDGGALWTYNKALYFFKMHGPDSKKASKQLVVAIGENPHIPKYLSGKKKLPDESPDSYINGSVDEAITYAEDSSVAWQRTKGALEWLSYFA